METYKFYRAQVTGGGLVPEGDCKATLALDDDRNPIWSDMTEEFERLCLPWFSNTMRMGKYGDPDPLVPYSLEALDHLAKHQLPSQGFTMATITGPKKPKAEEPAEEKKEEPKKAVPQFPQFHQPQFTPPPGLNIQHKPLS